VKHFQMKVLKALQHELTHPIPCYMPPYHPRHKFDFNDNNVIVLKAS